MRKNEKLVTEALLKLLREPYSGDLKGRTGAELLGLAIFRSAIQGSTPAATLIAERCEGKVKDVVEFNERTETEDIRERISRLTEKLRGEPQRIQ
jgi:hypothetical protein